MPNVKDRHDPEAAALQHSMNPGLVLAALDERSESTGQMKPAEETNEDEGKSIDVHSEARGE